MTFLYIALPVIIGFCLCGAWFGLCALFSALLKKYGAAFAAFGFRSVCCGVKNNGGIYSAKIRTYSNFALRCGNVGCGPFICRSRKFIYSAPPPFLERSCFGLLPAVLLWRFPSGCLCREHFLRSFALRLYSPSALALPTNRREILLSALWRTPPSVQ